MTATAPLAPLRAHAGARRTSGLDDATVDRFAATHPELVQAIAAAAAEYARIREEFADLLDLDEDAQLQAVPMREAAYGTLSAIDARKRAVNELERRIRALAAPTAK